MACLASALQCSCQFSDVQDPETLGMFTTLAVQCMGVFLIYRNCRNCVQRVTFHSPCPQGETYLPVPGSAFRVSRTAHRNNTSNYYINDRRSNFGEVTDMLKAKGIDLDNNRFLILQVDSLAWLACMHAAGQCHRSI